uniref:DNA polymerase Y family protein n=1 Tax=Salana multivorans TaxID=120377 RepID=UPI0024913745
GPRTAADSPRLGILWVPDWPVAAASTEQRIPMDLPVAVHDPQAILAASAPARRAGVRRGMRRRTAQQLCPELVLVPADTARDVRAFEPVVQAVEHVVADVEVVRPGMILFAAAGPARYLGGEEKVAEDLVGIIADEAGVECQVGMAEGYLAAVLAAREGIVVPPGTSAEFLADRDVRSLLHAATTREASAAWADLVDLLRRLGLRRLGDVAVLRTSDVAARFADLGLQAHRLARGLDARRPSVHRPDPDIAVGAELDPPAARIDTAAFVARRIAEDLHTRLLRRGAVCARLVVIARTTTEAELVRTWRIEGALTAGELTDRVRWQLEGWLSGRSGRPPAAPLRHLELVAQEVSPAGAAQEGLWGRRARGEVQAARAATRVQGMIGPDRVLVPVPEGGRAPRDRVRLVAWGDDATPRRPADAPWPGAVPPPLPTVLPITPPAVHLLDAGGEAVVVDARGLMSTTDGAPAELIVPRGEGLAWLVPGRHRVLAWAGPWPMTQRWWTPGGVRGSWLQVQVAVGGEPGGEGDAGPASSGVVLLLRRDDAWWVEGVVD